MIPLHRALSMSLAANGTVDHYRDNALNKVHFEPTSGRRTATSRRWSRRKLRWAEQVNLGLDLITARVFHGETLPQDCAKTLHFCCVFESNFYSVKITEDVRIYAAEQGVAEDEVIAKGME